MRSNIEHYVVVGSSSGLGAALVEELLKKTGACIIGIARRSLDKIEQYPNWNDSRRYRHIELDISSTGSAERLNSLCSEFGQGPACIIFNAARVETDIVSDGSIDHDIFRNVNQVGVDGLGNVLAGFGRHFLAYGGVLIGISSFSAFVPPLREMRVAYPASKAYLDMALRSLRMIWNERVKVIIVHLGHMSNSEAEAFPRWMAPTYPIVAKRIVRSILRRRLPNEINYPLFYCIAYKHILRFFPDTVYSKVLELFRSFIGRS